MKSSGHQYIFYYTVENNGNNTYWLKHTDNVDEANSIYSKHVTQLCLHAFGDNKFVLGFQTFEKRSIDFKFSDNSIVKFIIHAIEGSRLGHSDNEPYLYIKPNQIAAMHEIYHSRSTYLFRGGSQNIGFSQNLTMHDFASMTDLLRSTSKKNEFGLIRSSTYTLRGSPLVMELMAEFPNAQIIVNGKNELLCFTDADMLMLKFKYDI